MDKVVRVGASRTYSGRAYSVFCRILWDGTRLSITGVGGPLANGDALGSAGQCLDEVENVDALAPGWTPALLVRFLKTWRAWHLNDMRPGCEHQRALGWGSMRIDPSKPENAYGRHFPGQASDSWNLLGWVRPDEHPDGLLTRPCPVCGYKYGTAWLTEEVPPEVIEFLQSLPVTDVTPAWV